MLGAAARNDYAEVAMAEAPRSRCVICCMVDDPEAEGGQAEVSCDLKGETGSLSAIISEGQVYARGYQVDYFWNDPTKFAD